MNIVDYKTQIDTLTSNLIKEYNKIEDLYIKSKNSSYTELNDINNINSSITDCLQQKIDAINSLEKDILKYKDREREHIKQIDELKSTIESIQVEKEETNKFDMLRIQSKELVAKDKEIERLKKDVERLKGKNTPKPKVNIDIIPTNMMTSGWSTTSSVNPKISGIEPLKLEVDAVDEVKEVKEEVVNEYDDKDKGKDKDNDEECEYSVIVYRKHEYYLDPDNKVYEINDNEEVGKCIGSWVKQTSGKFKVVKN